MQQPEKWKLLQIMKSITEKREKSHPKPRRVEQQSRARLGGGGGNQVRAVGEERIIWQLEDKVKELELQAARDEELKKQFNVEKT